MTTYRGQLNGTRDGRGFASKKKLEKMGREWAFKCYRSGSKLTTWGNETHDKAAREEYARLTHK